MTDTWPTDRPGVPLHAERDGWHWLKHPEDLRPFPSAWNAELRGWPSGALHSPQGVVDLGFAYLGPCYTQADLDAAVAKARAEGMEKAARWHDCRAVELRWLWARYGASGFPVGGPHISPQEAEAQATVHEASAAAIRSAAAGEEGK